METIFILDVIKKCCAQTFGLGQAVKPLAESLCSWQIGEKHRFNSDRPSRFIKSKVA